ncbi:TPA: hypothetical protein ONA18_005142 [Pseudomonas aeruginosa]|uniref:hypothetical protein n=1 Tax=Pseudomonas sp. zfem002 TaxID=3078197 RepID=UPI002929DDD1|nr:hypothetical protein [Pseudomonas sp. zfem002]MDU9393234.1 hypothetical protein [Pseudomonas sp. zfem002]HCR1219417.1 hypothetical protein [Pseudomonas aeruginosa]
MLREDDAIRMIRDNERLIAENRQHAKEANQHRDAIDHLRGDLSITNAATARAEGAKELLAQQLEIKTNEVSEALSEATAAQRREGDLIQKLASAEAEIKELRVNSDASDLKA